MSGICGIVHFDRRPVDPDEIKSMTACLSHRGRDSIDDYCHQNAGLGHCMLRTTQRSLEEQQPWRCAQGTVSLVMDGRITNQREIRRQLRRAGCILRNESDAELLMQAFLLWQHTLLDYIEGDFAFVIWDAQRQRVFAATDSMGSRPLVYFYNGKSMVFASEVSAVLTLPWVPKHFNTPYAAEYLAVEYCSDNMTFWSDIMQLPPAHRCSATLQGLQCQRYWQPDYHAHLTYADNRDYIEHYRELLDRSVRAACDSHMPVGLEVSGGLDSSALFAIAQQLHRGGKLTTPAVPGFTMNCQRYPAANEIRYARAVAKHCRAMIHEVTPCLDPLQTYAERAASTLDFPGHPNSRISDNLMREARTANCKVIVSGCGADEWLDGSIHYYAEELALGNYNRVVQLLRADARQSGFRNALWWLLQYGVYATLPEKLRQTIRAMVMPVSSERVQWLAQPLKQSLARGKRQKQRRESPAQSLPTAKRLAFLTANNPTLRMHYARQELDSAAFGLELRRPFLQKDLVQFAISVPRRVLCSAEHYKNLHRKALHGTLPDSVLTRTDKAEFSMAFTHYLDDLHDYQNHAQSELAQWVEPAVLSKLKQQIERNGKNSHWAQWMLWNVTACHMLWTAAIAGGKTS